MKVIGIIPARYRSNPDSLLVEMTRDEFANVADGVANVEVGTTVDVDKIYNRLRKLKGNQHELAKARAQLRAVADLLEPLEGVVSCDAPAEELGDAKQSNQS